MEADSCALCPEEIEMLASRVNPLVVAVASLVIVALPAAAAHALTEPSPVSPSLPSPAPASSAPLGAAGRGPAGTNLTAVVDPIAVKVAEGFRIRVGARNSGPNSITVSAGQAAVVMHVYVVPGWWVGRVRSLGYCGFVPETPPRGDPPVVDIPISFFECIFRGTLLVGQTYWESFIFPDLPSSRGAVWIVVDSTDANSSDNRRDVVVRLAHADDPGGGLPVTGYRPLLAAGIAIALLVAGALMLWSGRRRTPHTA
jgi:hypothetical protein